MKRNGLIKKYNIEKISLYQTIEVLYKSINKNATNFYIDTETKLILSK